MEPAISCVALRRVFRSRGPLGKLRESVALNGLDLTVEYGEIFGLLGPNGAGKTTTIKILTTLLSPTEGVARVAGFDVVADATEVRRRIGFVFGGDRGLYWRLSGLDNLLYFAALYGLSGKQASERIASLLQLVGLDKDAHRRVEQYSRGMRQRLHVARGLLTDPEILVLDEPTLGVDPVGARDLRALVEGLRAPDRAILLTTHYMLEADLLCDRLAIINHGKLLMQGTPEEIKRSAPSLQVIEIEVFGTTSAAVERIKQLPGVQVVTSEQSGQLQRIRVSCHEARVLLHSAMEELSREARVDAAWVREPSLEDAYVSLVEQAVVA